MSVLEDSLGEEPTNDSVLRQLDISIQAERDPVKRASLFERQNAHLKRTLDAQKQRLHDLKEKELDLASSDLNRLQERMEQLAAENKELEKLATQGADGRAPKAATLLPVTADAPRDAPRNALDVLARESAAYVKKIESLEGSAAQLITRLRLQEEEEAEARRAKQVEALLQENRSFAARIEKFEETTVAAMQHEIDSLKVTVVVSRYDRAELAAVRRQVPPNLPVGAQQAVNAFMEKYGGMAGRAEQFEAQRQTNAQLSAELAELRGTHDQVAVQHAQLEAQYTELRAAHADLEAQHTELQATCEQLRAANSDLATRCEQHRAATGELEEQYEQLRAEHAALEEHNVTIASALKASQVEVEQLRAELASRAEAPPPTAKAHAQTDAPDPADAHEADLTEIETEPSEEAPTAAAARNLLPVVVESAPKSTEEAAHDDIDLQEERERAEIQLRALRTALLGLEAESAGLRQDKQRLQNEVAILDSENKRMFEEAQRGDGMRDELTALRTLLTDTARQRADLVRFLETGERSALDDAFAVLLRLLDEYEKYVAGRTGHAARLEHQPAALLAETHAEELRGLWQHVSSSNRNLLRLLTQQTAEVKSLQEQLQAQRLRAHMLADSSAGLKSALARAASELEEWHNRALGWERERAVLQSESQQWMNLVYAQAKEDLEEHRALLGLASSSQSVVGS